VIENAYKHLDVNPVVAAKAKEEPAPAKTKKLTARKVRNLAGVSRKK
jgi:2-isopropylmalate synthase